MKTNHSAHGASQGASATTTEELIVQYLDGELVRKELETVLFDRLAHSEDARTLLREYLVVRGAIRMTREDERFQLSDDLDHRTRTRIQQMMEALEAKSPAAPVRPVLRDKVLRDKAAIATSPVTRGTDRWVRRSAYAALALLLIAGAWFGGQREARHGTTPTSIAQTPQQHSETEQAGMLPMSSLTTNETDPVAEKARSVAHAAVHPEKASRHIESPSPSGTLASSASSQKSGNASVTPAASQAPDPADVMLSQRFAKAINSAKNNEVVVTSHDRL